MIDWPSNGDSKFSFLLRQPSAYSGNAMAVAMRPALSLITLATPKVEILARLLAAAFASIIVSLTASWRLSSALAFISLCEAKALVHLKKNSLLILLLGFFGCWQGFHLCGPSEILIDLVTS